MALCHNSLLVLPVPSAFLAGCARPARAWHARPLFCRLQMVLYAPKVLIHVFASRIARSFFSLIGRPFNPTSRINDFGGEHERDAKQRAKQASSGTASAVAGMDASRLAAGGAGGALDGARRRKGKSATEDPDSEWAAAGGSDTEDGFFTGHVALGTRFPRRQSMPALSYFPTSSTAAPIDPIS
jgi:hypothetical protein